jgi:hypothetical protein
MSAVVTPETAGEMERTPMESIEPTSLTRAAPSSLITDLELKVHPDSDVSSKFTYKMVTPREDELFYEANDLDEDLVRKLYRRVRRNNQGQVVAVTQTTVDTKFGEEEISSKKDELRRMDKDGLVEHLQYQILHHHALSEQRNMLWVLLNKAETSRALAALQLEELADNQDDLKHEHGQLRQEAANLRQRIRELEVHSRSSRPLRQATLDSTVVGLRQDREQREEPPQCPLQMQNDDNEEHTPFSTVSGTKKYTAKIPDPPILTDGITPSFESWKFQMLNKFETNADHYHRPTRAAEEAAKIGFAVTRIEGDAADHFFPWMRAKRRAEEEVTVESMMKLLEGVCDDPDKRITARKDLRKLTMKPFSDFNKFLADYTKLANESRLELDQWKEDFHDKLYDNLQVQMEIYLDNERISFDEYCSFAKAYARGMSSKESNRKERNSDNNAKALKSRRGGSTASATPQKAQALTAPAADKAAAAGKADKTIACYKCGKNGHIARNCYNNAESKAVNTEKKREVETDDSENELA